MWLLPACVLGAPPGFSPGESWTFPLVDPLVHEPLITPVTVGGKGPFLFILDPDAFTGIDVGFLSAIPAFGNGPSYAPLSDVQIGSLHVDSLPFIARPMHAFDTANRRIAGVIGKEVITGALVVGFDRDRGIAWLATPKHAALPPGARSLDYWEGPSPDRTAPRDRGPYVTGTIDGREQDLHVDLGRTSNMLRPDRWDGLAVHDELRTITFEDGERKDTSRVATAKHVTAGRSAAGENGVERFGVTFAPFVDRNYLAGERAATVGLDFLWDFAVAVSFDAHRIYVTPRTPVAPGPRIARWALPCKHTGCAALALHGKDLEVTPEHVPVQLVVSAMAHDGTALPPLEVNLDAGAEHFAVALDDKYADAVLEVTDASPFPRTCVDAKQCVVPYAR
jgi:hypothetical protein